MPEVTSPWRVNDVVAYDLMRGSATTLLGLLQATMRAGNDEAQHAARTEIAATRRNLATIDPYDRTAVAALADRFTARIDELKGQPR